MDIRYEVFISSTFIDLTEERAKVVQAVLRLGFFPNGMETFPASNDSQRKVIERAIAGSDYYVVIVAGRYGSLTETNLSYTEAEFDYAVAQRIPVLAFVHADPDKIAQGKTDKNDEARKRLDLFREKVRKNRTCDHWINPDELAAKVTAALTTAVKDSPRPGWVRGPGDGGVEREHPPSTPRALERPKPSMALLRSYLQDDRYVEFEELTSEAVTSASMAVSSIRTEIEPPPETYRALVDQCEVAAADLTQIAAETAYFGKTAHHGVLLNAVEQLAALTERCTGSQNLCQLRAYPALLAFYAAGTATTARREFGLLRKFHALQLVEPVRGKAPALRVLSPH